MIPVARDVSCLRAQLNVIKKNPLLRGGHSLWWWWWWRQCGCHGGHGRRLRPCHGSRRLGAMGIGTPACK